MKIVILAIIVIAVLGNLYEEHKYDIEYAVGDAVQGVFQDTGDQKTNDTDETDYDHYQYVTREIPKKEKVQTMNLLPAIMWQVWRSRRESIQ